MLDFLDLEPKPNFSQALPADPISDNYPRQVTGACFSRVSTKIPSQPEMLHYSSQFLNQLRLTINKPAEFLKIMSGAQLFNHFQPFAMCYGGHQFGHWAGQLGDGRAINIAELKINKQFWQFQLKGSGPTPYSRTADGFAVLRSSVREYLCSEAMFHLGVPTTRALSLVKTGDKVVRDMLYDGHPKEEQGAIVCRVAHSFIRFGNFEILAARQDKTLLKQLLDYTIIQHFSHLGLPDKNSYIAFFNEVAVSTREMIVHWQRVGFVHGVMNTDNMSILSLTIDYGPYGWLEDYQPDWTPNTTDAQHGRYRFGNQPMVALWNLNQLANAIYPLINEAEPLQSILNDFRSSYSKSYHVMMCGKLGLYQPTQVKEEFVNQLEELLIAAEIDMTIFFRELSGEQEDVFQKFWETVLFSSYKEEALLESTKGAWRQWFDEYDRKITTENDDKKARMSKMQLTNPKYVLRNYMAQLAIDEAEKGDYKLIDEMYQMLCKPYNEQPQYNKWYTKRPEWARHKVGCSMLSCSS